MNVEIVLDHNDGLGVCEVVFQIGTAKYGVREENGRLSETRLIEMAADSRIKMFEIKLSQGAKPGKGGILPGAKVTPEIAAIRGIPSRRTAISSLPPSANCST